MNPVLSPKARTGAAPSGARLLASDGRALPLEGTAIHAEARGGIARVVLEQHFRNVYAEPLIVTYLVPLPADGAVSGFAFRIGERRVQGEIDRRQAARERFERAVVEGRAAAILEQERASQFTQEIGNIPPGGLVTAEITIDQRLSWREEGAWEWRFPTVVAPSYPGAPGRVPDAERVTVDVATDPIAARAELSLTIGDALPDGRVPESPSHPLVSTTEGGTTHVRFEPADLVITDQPPPGWQEERPGSRLDRDVVVRWAAARGEVGVSLVTARPATGTESDEAYGLLTLVPPGLAEPHPSFPRDLIVLIDSSGSMDGEPFAHARAVAAAVATSLEPADRLELIAFGLEPVRWRKKPAPAEAGALAEAVRWLYALRPQGGTEMLSAIKAAFASLRPDSQRQIVLITDGLVGFESEIVTAVLRDLPASSRFHVVGVGSAPNRSLTACAARAGRGVEVLVGLGEDTADAGRRLVVRTRAPLLTDVSLEGTALVAHAPGRIPDLFGAAPILIPLRLAAGGGTVRVRARTPQGPWEATLALGPVEAGSGSGALAALYGREAVEDLEARVASGATDGLDAEIERLGLAYRIATRLTSWVAVSEEPSVDPGQPFHRERMPHAVPYGMSVEGLGLRSAAGIAGSIPMSLLSPRFLAGVVAQSPMPAGETFDRRFPGRIPPAMRDILRSTGEMDAPSSLRRKPGAPRPRRSIEQFLAQRGGAMPPASDWLVGTVLVRRRGQLVIETEASRDLDWGPDWVVVQWGNGTVSMPVIEPVATTKPGLIQRGMRIRLVLNRAPEKAGERIEAIVIGIRDEKDPIVIRIEP